MDRIISGKFSRNIQVVSKCIYPESGHQRSHCPAARKRPQRRRLRELRPSNCSTQFCPPWQLRLFGSRIVLKKIHSKTNLSKWANQLQIYGEVPVFHAVGSSVWRQHLPELFLVLSLLPVQLLRHDLVFLLQLEAVVEDLCSAICRFSVFLQPLFFDLDLFIFCCGPSKWARASKAVVAVNFWASTVYCILLRELVFCSSTSLFDLRVSWSREVSCSLNKNFSRLTKFLPYGEI